MSDTIQSEAEVLSHGKKDQPIQERPDKLPWSGLLALAMTGFIAIMTETLPAGLLPQIGAGLDVPDSLTGQLVTAYAMGSVVAAMPNAILTRSWRRQHVLLLAIIGFFAFNTITAVSSNYGLTLVARFLAGAAAGITWGLVPVYARRLVAAHVQGRAMAIALVGTPLALCLGVPVGTWLGAYAGWRLAFGVMSVMALVLIIWALVGVRDLPGETASNRTTLGGVVRKPGIRPMLMVVVLWMLAHNILYTYVAPFLAPAGLIGQVGLVLLVFGAGALVGIALVGALIDRWLRHLVLGSLSLFALVAVTLAVAGSTPLVVYLGAALWGLTFGGAATLLQTASADVAGDGADLAQSMIVTVWNLAIAGGGAIGGLLLKNVGAASFPLVIVLLLTAAIAVAWVNGARSFASVARTTEAERASPVAADVSPPTGCLQDVVPIPLGPADLSHRRH